MVGEGERGVADARGEELDERRRLRPIERRGRHRHEQQNANDGGEIGPRRICRRRIAGRAERRAQARLEFSPRGADFGDGPPRGVDALHRRPADAHFRP